MVVDHLIFCKTSEEINKTVKHLTSFLIQNDSFGIGKTKENFPVARLASCLGQLLCQTYMHMKFIA